MRGLPRRKYIARSLYTLIGFRNIPLSAQDIYLKTVSSKFSAFSLVATARRKKR